MSAITFEALAGQLKMETSQWTGPLDKAGGHLQKFAAAATNAFAIVGRRMDMAGAAFLGLGAAAAAGIGKTIKMASDAEEAASKFGFVFGKAADQTRKALDQFANDAKRSRYELRGMAADIGALLGPMGFSADKTSEMSVAFTKLATDLSSFFNITESDALTALRSGIVGETEPLRRLGVNLSQVKIEAEAMRLGLVKGQRSSAEMMTAQVRLAKASENVAKATKQYGAGSIQAANAQAEYARAEEAMTKAMKGRKVQMDAATKAQAVYSIIMRETKQAQGDAERTSGSFANTLRGFLGTVKDLAIEFGGPFLNAAVASLDVFDQMVKANRAAIMGFAQWVGSVATAEKVQAFWQRLFATVSSLWQSAGRLIDRLQGLGGVFAGLWGKAKPAVDGLKRFWDSLPQGVRDVLKVTAALMGASVVLTKFGGAIPFVGSFSRALGGLINPVGWIADGFKILWPFLKMLGPVLAAATGPVGLTVAGIAALGAGIVAWVRYTETGGKVWQWLVGLVSTGIQWLAGLWERHGAQVQRILGKLWQLFAVVWGAIWAAVQNVWQNLLLPFAKDLWAIVQKIVGFFAGIGLAAIKAWAAQTELAIKIVLEAFETLIDVLSGDGRRFQAIMLSITAAMVDMMAAAIEGVPGMDWLVTKLKAAGEVARAQAAELRGQLKAEEDAAAAEAKRKAEAEAAANAPKAAGPAGAGTATEGGLMSDEELADAQRSGSAEFGGVLGAALGVADKINLDDPSMKGGHDRKLKLTDAQTAGKERLTAAAGFRRGQMNRMMRGASPDMSREQRAEMHGLAGDVFEANQRATLTRAGTPERADALAKAQEAFDKFTAFLDEAAGKGKQAADGVAAALEEGGAKVAAGGDKAAEQVAAGGEAAAEKAAEGGEVAGAAIADGVAEPLVAGAEVAAEKLVDGADAAADKMVEVAEERENARQDRAEKAELERQRKAEEARNKHYKELPNGGDDRLGNLVNGLGAGVSNAMTAVANAQTTMAKILNSRDPELIRQTMEAKAGAEMQQLKINSRFGVPGVGTPTLGFGPIRKVVAPNGGSNLPGGGAVSRFGDASPVGMASAGGVNVNMNFEGEFTADKARAAVDVMDAEIRRRGQDATGRSPLRRTIRGPINSRKR